MPKINESAEKRAFEYMARQSSEFVVSSPRWNSLALHPKWQLNILCLWLSTEYPGSIGFLIRGFPRMPHRN